MSIYKKTKIRLTDLKRLAILEASVDEFHTNGFAGASMDRIAERAKVSKRTVYNHFPSKEALFQVIIEDLAGKVELSYPAFCAETALDKQLFVVGKKFAEAISSDEVMKLARVVISRFIQDPELAKSTLDKQSKLTERVVGWMGEAKKSGALKVSDPAFAAAQFTGLIKSFVFWPQLIGSLAPLSTRDRNKVVKCTVEMFLSRYSQ